MTARHTRDHGGGNNQAWSGHLTVRGLQLYIEHSGTDAPRAPVLLLHGFTGSHASWSAVAAVLAANRPVITVDLPGHGRSDAPQDPARFGTEEVTADLVAMMAQLGYSTFDCVGYSMGGRVALSLACLQRPVVRNLVLESASPGLRTADERALRRHSDDALAAEIDRSGVAAFVDHWADLPLFATQRGLSADQLHRQRMIRLANTATGLANSLRGLGTGRQPSWWDVLPTLNLPILLMTGALDAKFTAIAREMLAALSGARHDVLEGVGHAIHVERPELWVTTVQSFLDGTSVDALPRL